MGWLLVDVHHGESDGNDDQIDDASSEHESSEALERGLETGGKAANDENEQAEERHENGHGFSLRVSGSSYSKPCILCVTRLHVLPTPFSAPLYTTTTFFFFFIKVGIKMCKCVIEGVSRSHKTLFWPLPLDLSVRKFSGDFPDLRIFGYYGPLLDPLTAPTSGFHPGSSWDPHT